MRPRMFTCSTESGSGSSCGGAKTARGMLAMMFIEQRASHKCPIAESCHGPAGLLCKRPLRLSQLGLWKLGPAG